MSSIPSANEQLARRRPEDAEEDQILPNSAITVANGHLIVATHVDFIVEMLQRPIGTDLLTDAADYQHGDRTLWPKSGPSSRAFGSLPGPTKRIVRPTS